VKRVTLNRPEKRNALFHPLRGAIMDALREGDLDDDIKVMIVRGNGPSFSAGYDLGGGNEGHEYPHYTAPGEGQWPRHVTDTWMSIWDMSKPVIAQVHGYCLAGGSELATGCDMVYMADVIIHNNVVIKNRFGHIDVRVTDEAVNDLRKLSLESQKEFFTGL